MVCSATGGHRQTQYSSGSGGAGGRLCSGSRYGSDSPYSRNGRQSASGRSHSRAGGRQPSLLTSAPAIRVSGDDLRSADRCWNLLETVRKGLPPQAVSLAGAMAHADLVAFGPRGDAAVLYSKDSGRLEIITDLPAKPAVRELSLAGFREVMQLALSDDGLMLAAQLSDTRLIYSSQGSHWQPLSGSILPPLGLLCQTLMTWRLPIPCKVRSLCIVNSMAASTFPRCKIYTPTV